jgi:hypothetical protein
MQSSSSSSSTEQVTLKEKLHLMIGRALNYFNQVYEPFTKQLLQHVYQQSYELKVKSILSMIKQPQRNDKQSSSSSTISDISIDTFDTQGIILLLTRSWADIQNISNSPLQDIHRNYLFELKGVRNKWAHQNEFNLRDAYRAFDTIERLLSIQILRSDSQKIELNKMREYVLLHMANEVKRKQQREEEAKKKPVSSRSSNNSNNNQKLPEQYSFGNVGIPLSSSVTQQQPQQQQQQYLDSDAMDFDEY